MLLLQCDKCKQKQSVAPSRNAMTCNLHSVNEPTGYCQGKLRPLAQMSTGTYVPPTGTNKGKQTGYENQ